MRATSNDALERSSIKSIFIVSFVVVADTITTCYDQCTSITVNIVLVLPGSVVTFDCWCADALMLFETTGRRSDDSRVVRLDV